MNFGRWVTERHIGAFLVLILAAPTVKAAALPKQNEAIARADQTAQQNEAGNPDAAGSMRSSDSPQPASTLPDAPEVAQAQSPTANGQSSSSQPSQQPEQNEPAPARPLGTAAAPSVTRTGVTASKPAGAAIAPAKQRRVRTILISLAVVAAAGVAIGTVAGVSRTSPSQPK